MAQVSKKARVKCCHPKEKQTIVVLSAICGCETTRVLCTKCEKYLTPPKTDC